MERNIVIVDEESGDEQLLATVGSATSEGVAVAVAKGMLEWAGFCAIAEEPMRYQSDWGWSIQRGIQRIEVRDAA